MVERPDGSHSSVQCTWLLAWSLPKGKWSSDCKNIHKYSLIRWNKEFAGLNARRFIWRKTGTWPTVSLQWSTVRMCFGHRYCEACQDGRKDEQIKVQREHCGKTAHNPSGLYMISFQQKRGKVSLSSTTMTQNYQNNTGAASRKVLGEKETWN